MARTARVAAPAISVVVPAHCTQGRHGTSRLRLTLAGYARQTLPRDAFEIVVVDDGSDPPLGPQIAEWRLPVDVELVRRERGGIASAYNAGVEAAGSSLVFFATDDELPSPQLLEEHVRAHSEEPGRLVVGQSLFLLHTALFHDVTTADLVPGAIEAIAASAEFGWLAPAVDAFDLTRKPVTLRDVEEDFDRLLGLASSIPQFRDIEHTISTGAYKRLRAGWLVMRVGNHSLARETLAAVGGVDEALDAHASWYLDLDLGIRLLDEDVEMVFRERAVSINLWHFKDPDAPAGELSAFLYLIDKHRRTDVLLLPFFFARQMAIADYSSLVERAERAAAAPVAPE